MTSERYNRLVDAGWSVTCERYIGIDLSGPNRTDDRFCTWRASKGANQVVVKAKFGDDQSAIIELYNAAKVIDPDLRQIAANAGSGAWVFDLSKANAKTDR
jgi:hypothetical protein